MFMIRTQFWDMVGNSTGEDSRRRLDEQAEQLDNLIADTVATSVEGIAAQLCLLTTFLESSPLGEYGNDDADKRLIAAIYAGIQGFIDRRDAEWKADRRDKPLGFGAHGGEAQP